MQETWLDPSFHKINLIDNWVQIDNSVGKGKGILTCFKPNFAWRSNVTRPNYQLTKICSEELTIINVYRSAGADTANFIDDLVSLVENSKDTLIVGDFNICYALHQFHEVFVTLTSMGFDQLVQKPTHIDGGQIDLVFLHASNSSMVFEVNQQAQFFTDHDLIEVVKKCRME